MLSGANRFRVRGAVVLFLFVVATVVAACGGAAGVLSTVGSSVGGAPVGGGPLPAASAGPAGAPQGNGNGNNPAGGGTVVTPAVRDLLIIKTGALAIQVAGLDAALTNATDQITALGGYASGSDRSGDGDDAQASITFRIPAARWEEALKGLRGLGEKVLNERSSTEEVTSQVIDLGARIKNLQSTETALQGIMTQATDIDDILSVQSRLTEIRGQIEQLTAQKSHLEEQAAFSTVTVTFALKPNPVLTEAQGFDPATEVDQALGSLVGMLQALATAGIWFAIVWVPILLFVGLIVGIGVVIYRRARRDELAGRGPGAPAAPAAESGA